MAVAVGGAGGLAVSAAEDRIPREADFCTFMCSAKPLTNRFFGVVICFAAGLGLLGYGIASTILESDPNKWQRLMYIGFGMLTIASGAIALGKLCVMYRSFRRQQEQQPAGQSVALQGNLGQQQPQIWATTGQYTTPNPYNGPPGQPPPGYEATVGPQYPAGEAYPQQQPYPQAWGAVPSQQLPPPVQTGLSDGTSTAPYPAADPAQEPSIPPPPTYDEVVKK